MSTSLPISKIIVALDLHDDLGEAVLKTGVALSERLGAKLHIVDIWPSLTTVTHPYDQMSVAAELEQYESKRVARAAALQRRVEQTAPGAVAASPTGAAADTIVDYIKSEQGDLLVIGSHQKNFWQRLVFGSVSEEAIHEAPCAVFVVTPEYAKTVS